MAQASPPLSQLNCTEADLNSMIPCLRCVSKDDLINFQVRLLLQITAQDITPEAVQELFCTNCHSDEDLIRMETALWAELAVFLGARADWTVEDLMDETKCYKCTNPHLMRTARLLLLCVWIRNQSLV